MSRVRHMSLTVVSVLLFLHHQRHHQYHHEAKGREMKGLSKITQLWLVAKQSLPLQWVFPLHHPETALLPGPNILQHFMENT